MFSGLKERSEQIIDNEFCQIATALDCRYKLRFFNVAMRENVKVDILQKMAQFDQEGEDDISQSSTPAPKRQKKTSLDFDDILDVSE